VIDLDWVVNRTEGAPDALRDKVLEYLGGADTRSPDDLALAGNRALRDSLGRDPGRDAALELLCADALITLALLAQAETDPAGLDRFAAALVSGDIATG